MTVRTGWLSRRLLVRRPLAFEADADPGSHMGNCLNEVAALMEVDDT